jgi:ribosomal protein L21E
MSEILTYHIPNGKAKLAIEELQSNSDLNNLILSMCILPDTEGYLLIEVLEKDKFVNSCFGSKYIRGLVRGNVRVDEVVKQMDVLEDFEVGERVIINDGPFKNSKGRISRVEKTGAVVVLDDSAVNIPIKLDKGCFSKDKAYVKSNRNNIMIGAQKTMGVRKTVECTCGYELEYLYIPAHRSEMCDNAGKKIYPCQVNAKVLGVNECPQCNKKTLKVFKNTEPGSKILK